MSQLCITKGAIPKKLNKSFTRIEGKKRCDTEKSTPSSNVMTCDDSLINQSRDISAHKRDEYNAAESMKVMQDKPSKALNYNIQSKQRQFRFNKRNETRGDVPEQNYVSTKDIGNKFRSGNNNRNVMDDGLSSAQTASQGSSAWKEVDCIVSGNKMPSEDSNVQNSGIKGNHQFGTYANISSKAGTTKQNNIDMIQPGYGMFDRNIKRIEKNENEVKSTNVKNSRKKGKKKTNGKKKQEILSKKENKLPETDTTQFQQLSYADTVRYGVKRETSTTYMNLNYYSNVENSPESLMAQPSKSTTKVGHNIRYNEDQCQSQEVPDIHPVHQTKCNTKNKTNINLHSKSKARKELFSNLRENSTRRKPFNNNNKYNSEMNSQVDHRESFVDFCKRVCNIFTLMTQGRNLLMIKGTLSLQDDPVDLEKETATLTEIHDHPEGDEEAGNLVAEESQKTVQMKVHEPQIILEESKNYAQDESNKIQAVKSISGFSTDSLVNFPKYQHKHEHIFIKPNTLLNKMKCIPGTWSIETDTKTNGNIWVMNGKPLECTMTTINCNFATLSIARLPIIPQFDARNMILMTSPIGNDVSIIPKTIFTVSTPPVDYNAIGAWYLIFNNPYVLNGTCAGEWFWSPYIQPGVREVVFYWIPHCTSQFMNESIDAVWIWFPTPPAAKDSAKYIIPHMLMKKNPCNSGDENKKTDVSFITV